MFFCESCRKARSWPASMFTSGGQCEVCEQMAVCYDVPSSQLPEPQFQADIEIDERMAAMGLKVVKEGDNIIYEVPAGHPLEEIINRASADEGVRMTRPPRRQK